MVVKRGSTVSGSLAICVAAHFTKKFAVVIDYPNVHVLFFAGRTVLSCNNIASYMLQSFTLPLGLAV